MLVLPSLLRCSVVANLNVLVLCYNAHGECDGRFDTINILCVPLGLLPVDHIWVMFSDTAGEFVGEN